MTSKIKCWTEHSLCIYATDENVPLIEPCQFSAEDVLIVQDGYRCLILRNDGRWYRTTRGMVSLRRNTMRVTERYNEALRGLLRVGPVASEDFQGVVALDTKTVFFQISGGTNEPRVLVNMNYLWELDLYRQNVAFIQVKYGKQRCNAYLPCRFGKDRLRLLRNALCRVYTEYRERRFCQHIGRMNALDKNEGWARYPDPDLGKKRW